MAEAQIVAGVFARGGSKGVPNKNLRVVGGQSLIQRAVLQSRQARHVYRVLCSTDSPHIADEARRYGAEVPWLRPSDLAQDTSREWDSWCHMVRYLRDSGDNPRYLMAVPCVAPLRTLDDLNKCTELATASDADVVMAVSDAHKNPWFNMVKIDDVSQQVRLVNEPAQRIYNRQAAHRSMTSQQLLSSSSAITSWKQPPYMTVKPARSSCLKLIALTSIRKKTLPMPSSFSANVKRRSHESRKDP